MNPEFYVMRPWHDKLFGGRYACADVCDPHNTGEPGAFGTCPVCNKALGKRPWLLPHRIELSKRLYPDFLWGAGFLLMVSERFLDGYRASGMTGITHVDPPAEVLRIGGRPVASVSPTPPPYHSVWYVHGGASLDDGGSESVRRPPRCAHCRQSIDGIKRVVLEDGSWTGADIFQAFGLPGQILVTTRFKSLCDEWEMTGSTFIAAEEYKLVPKIYPSVYAGPKD